MNKPLSLCYSLAVLPDSDTSRHSSGISFRSSLSRLFSCKSQVSFDILEMFHQGTQKELEFVEF